MRHLSALPPDVSFATYESVTTKTLLTTISKSPNVSYLLFHGPVEVLVSHIANAHYSRVLIIFTLLGRRSSPQERLK